METWLSWQNLIFSIPLVSGLLLLMGSMGGADHDADSDAHAGDDGHEGEASNIHALDAASLSHRLRQGLRLVLSWLGLGKAPLMFVLATWSVTFGAMGLALGTLGGALGIRLGAAAASATVLTHLASQVVHHLVPRSESYNVTREHLIGRTGVLLLPASCTGGLAQVRDHEGNLHQLMVRSEEGEIPKGSQVLVIDAPQPGARTYMVTVMPENENTNV